MSQDATPGSVLSRLRERHEEFRSQRSLEKDIPGYNGLLVARLAPVPWETLKAIGRRADKNKRNPEMEVIGAADTILHATKELLYREDGELKPLLHNGQEVVFDKGLASILGLKAETAREILRETFPDPYAIVAFYSEFMEWQGEGDAEEDEFDDEIKSDPTSTSSPTERAPASP